MPRANPDKVPLGVCKVTTTSIYSEPSTVYYDSDTLGVYAFRRDFVSTNFPAFREYKRKKLPLPIQVHSMSTVSDRGTPYHSYYEETNDLGDRIFWSDTTYSNTCVYATSTPLDASPLTEAIVKAESRFREKVADMSINLAQAFGEREQTAMLISNTVERVLKGAREVKSGRFLQAATTLRMGKRLADHVVRSVKRIDPKDYTSLWLEYKYGWQPLMQDIHGAIDLLNKKINSPDGLRVKTSAKSFHRTSDSIWDVQKSTHARLSYVCHVEDDLKSFVANTGISNPALLAWELMPFSFVIDWFLPVGNYLEGLTAYDGFYFTHGTVSTYTKGTCVGNFRSNYYRRISGKAHELGFSSGLRQQERTSYVRTPSAYPPNLPPSFRNPIGGNPADRVFTAVSLLHQVFGSTSKRVS